MKKNIVLLAAGAMTISLCGCAKHSTAYTAESYYLYPESMKMAGVKRRVSNVYIPDSDSNYTDPAEVREQVQPATSHNVTDCDYSAGVCEVYSLNDGDETKIAPVTYSYRFNDKKLWISRSGNNIFTEYVYEDDKLVSFAEYEGTGKTADSVPLRQMILDYDANGIGTHCKLIDNTEEAASNYDYTLEYDEQGRLIRINIMQAGAFKGHSILTYNEKGLLATLTVYVIVSENEEKILTYTEYVYE